MNRLEYFLPVTYILAFVHEKREGILERSLISGKELFVTYIMVIKQNSLRVRDCW